MNTTIIFAAAFHVIPCEYVIDLGPAPVPFTYAMYVTCEARDGTRLERLNPQFNKGSDPEGNRDFLMIAFESEGWVCRAGSGNSLIVMSTTGVKKSPIKSVVIESDKAIPVTVRWVPLKLEKKK